MSIDTAGMYRNEHGVGEAIGAAGLDRGAPGRRGPDPDTFDMVPR